MYAIVGLGNPGKEYSKTRHNVGFDVIDILSKKTNISVEKLKFKAVFGTGQIGTEKVFLVKPLTYMNNSGEAVRELLNYYNIPTNNLIVICDDVDIAFASLRIRKSGSAGTHNGLKSIIYHLTDDSFPRIRIGVGNNLNNHNLADYVLSQFNSEDRFEIDNVIETASEAIIEFVKNGIDSAMNKYNTKKIK